jgi:hypothetical protein
VRRRTRLRRRRGVHRPGDRLLPAVGAIFAVVLAVGLGIELLAGGESAASTHRHDLSFSQAVPDGTPLDHTDWPPRAGPYYPATAGYGVPGRWVSEGYWVHTLLHGGVVVLYRCGGDCSAIERTLAADVATFPPSRSWEKVKILALPTDRIDQGIVLVAFGATEHLPAWDRARALRFYREHLDRGPMDAP